MPPIKPGIRIASDDHELLRIVQFERALTAFDHALNERKRAAEICSRPAFQEIYQRRGCPGYFEQYERTRLRKTKKPFEIIDLDALEQKYQTARGKAKVKCENEFFKAVLFLRCCAIERYSSTIDLVSVCELIDRVTIGKDKNAVFALIELDTGFLTAPYVQSAIRRAEITNDKVFTRRLAEALLKDQRFPDGRSIAIVPIKPKKISLKRGSNDPQRNRFALSMALAAVGNGATETEIANFFRRYNLAIGRMINRKISEAFTSYESKGAVHQALLEFKLRREKAKPGRKKSV